jgi:integrase
VTAPRKARRKQRGAIDELPSGALRVRVYAGVDPISGRRHDLTEVIPPGPKAASLAEATLTRFLNQVDEQRNPRTSATVDQLLDRYLSTLDVGRTTKNGYVRYMAKHVRPFVGHLKAGALDAEALDSLYAELRRCRLHCTGRAQFDHRTPQQHACDSRCRPHACRPLANSTIRQIHFILSGAYKKAVRWRWVSINPVTMAEPPAAPAPDPQPPTAEEAARLIQEAWLDPDWGTLVWLTMTTGARRGELCALRWSHVDLPTGTITFRRGVAQDGSFLWEKDTKTHQQRRVTIDPETVAVLTEHWDRCRSRAVALDLPLPQTAFVFSNAPDGSSHLVPGSVTQRYSRLADRLGIDTHLHALRHYSATELIAAGVDVRTVAGRLGHGGGGITTLRVYAAWLAESDQRAASGLLARMPARPETGLQRSDRAKTDPRSPMERLAAELRSRILSGEFPVDSYLPAMKQLAESHGVAVSTAHRSVTLLKEWGLVDAKRGQRVRVVASVNEHSELATTPPFVQAEPGRGPQMLDLEIRHRGAIFRRLSAEADPRDADVLRRLLIGALRRAGREDSNVADYEMDIRVGDQLVTTFVVAG